MKGKKSDDGPTFIPFDDENIEHVMGGPDYGQVDTGSKSTAWDELSSKEYIDFVDEIYDKILSHQYNISKKF